MADTIPRKYNATVKTMQGSTTVFSIEAVDFSTAMEQLTKNIFKGEYQSTLDYSKVQSVQMYERGIA